MLTIDFGYFKEKEMLSANSSHASTIRPFFLVAFSILLTSSAHGQAITFTKVVDSNTPIPGKPGTFTTYFDRPSIGNGNVMLASGDFGQGHLYGTEGGLHVLAGLETPIPNGTGDFTAIASSSFDGNSVVFHGRGAGGQTGIYSDYNGLHRIVDRITPFPGGVGDFTALGGDLSQDGGNVAFGGTDSISGTKAMFTSIGGTLNVIADTNTAIPGGVGNFITLVNPSISGTDVAFLSFGSPLGEGIYAHLADELILIADTNTPVPGGIGNITTVGSDPVIDGDRIAFHASGVGQKGIYTYLNGSLDVLLDLNTPLPGGSGFFFDLPSFEFSLSGENIAFLGEIASGSSNLYSLFNNNLIEVIGLGDTLDGKIVKNLEMGKEAMSGNEIVFYALFQDDSSGVFVATIPEPTTIFLFSTASIIALRRRRQK